MWQNLVDNEQYAHIEIYVNEKLIKHAFGVDFEAGYVMYADEKTETSPEPFKHLAGKTYAFQAFGNIKLLLREAAPVAVRQWYANGIPATARMG